MSHVNYNEFQLSIGSQSFDVVHSSDSNNFQLSNFQHPGLHLTDVSHPNIDDSILYSSSLNNDDHDFGMDDAFLDCTPASCHHLFYISSLYEGGFQPFFFPIDIVPPSPIKHQLCQSHDNSFQSSTKLSQQSTISELFQPNKPSSQASTKSTFPSLTKPSLQSIKSELLQPTILLPSHLPNRLFSQPNRKYSSLPNLVSSHQLNLISNHLPNHSSHFISLLQPIQGSRNYL